MQALETIKVILDFVPSSAVSETSVYHPSMTIFAAFDTPQWRAFRLRPRNASCIACGNNPSVSARTIQSGDYEALCRRTNLPEIKDRVSVEVDS
jgi:adenylyltransferase/sulfurtransferase